MSRTGDYYIGLFDDVNEALESDRVDASYLCRCLRSFFLVSLKNGFLYIDGCKLSDGSRFSFTLPVENGSVCITGNLRAAVHEHTLI